MEQVTEQAPNQAGRFKPGQSGNRHGRGSLKVRAAAAEVERQVVVAELLADLDHPPTTAERLLIDSIASQVVEARRLRARGQSTAEPDRLITRMVGKLLPSGRRQAPQLHGQLDQYLAARRREKAPTEPPRAPDGPRKASPGGRPDGGYG